MPDFTCKCPGRSSIGPPDMEGRTCLACGAPYVPAPGDN